MASNSQSDSHGQKGSTGSILTGVMSGNKTRLEPVDTEIAHAASPIPIVSVLIKQDLQSQKTISREEQKLDVDARPAADNNHVSVNRKAS